MNQNICRLCNENIGVTSLFERIDCGVRLSAKVMYCAKVTVVEGDGLPSNICTTCKLQLETTYNFVIKCEQTDLKLRSSGLMLKKEKCDSEYDVKEGEYLNSVTHDDTNEEPSEEFEVKIESLDTSIPTNRSDAPKEIFVNFDMKKESSDTGIKIKRKYTKQSDALRKDNIDLDVKKETPDTRVRTKRKYTKKSDSHKKSVVKSASIKCKVCGRICISPSTLVIHMRSHTDERPFPCLSCDKKYKDGGSLKRHTERNHLDNVRERRFVCEQCGKSFFTKSDCKIHTRIHTGELPYACSKCPARFTQIGSLHRHKLRHTGIKSHECSTCLKKFSTKQELSKHYYTHTAEKKYQCPICKLRMKYKNNLKKHIRAHTETSRNNYICNDCGRGYPLKGNLLLHIRKLHSSKSGYCNECLKNVPNIEMHMWRHTGERPLKCEICPSSFFDLKGLSRHVSFKHKFVDRYHCTVNDCTKKFPSQAMVDYHIVRYHKAIKPFACDMCSRSFYRNSDLARHKKGSHK